VRVGFERGHLLPDPEGAFDPGGKQVRYVTVNDLTPAVAAQLSEFVDYAVHLRDSQLADERCEIH
jgi:hypothetical protein